VPSGRTPAAEHVPLSYCADADLWADLYCRLYRIVDGQLRRVPEQVPPLNRKGFACWPPGWGPGSGVCRASGEAGRTGEAAAEQPASAGEGGGAGSGSAARAVRTQRDVFELLGLPYREPHQRDCP
jgi:hypothetical protein